MFVGSHNFFRNNLYFYIFTFTFWTFHISFSPCILLFTLQNLEFCITDRAYLVIILQIYIEFSFYCG